MGSARKKVRPSAPGLPPVMVVVNSTVSPLVGTAVGQKALPARKIWLGVSWSNAPGVVPRRDADPLMVHPPWDGSGIVTVAVAVPVSVVVVVPALLAMVSVPVKVPAAAGAKLEVAVRVAPGARVAPLAGRPATVNGAAGAVIELIVSGLPPVLAMVMLRLLLEPMTIVPWSTVGVVVRMPGGGVVALPVSAIETLLVVLVVIAVAVLGPATVGV